MEWKTFDTLPDDGQMCDMQETDAFGTYVLEDIIWKLYITPRLGAIGRFILKEKKHPITFYPKENSVWRAK